ncbi:probable DNA helicase MCM8 isoform X2 [Miscanthus floridulus]|uniref:probable DNA helicase MCM8 isoform X2 n=1 Tax=Miscanthus floridulus TaxID=154761 RepID=UPI003458FC8B
MYADTMKGHQPKGRTRDDDTFKRLAGAWPTYFPEKAEVGLSESDHKVRLATALAESFSTLEVAEVLFSRIKDDGNDIICLPIDFQQLQEMCVFIKDKLNESPKEALLCMGVAADLALRSSKINKIFLNAKFNKINIRLYNTGPVIALKQLKAAFIKKLITVHGTVLKVSPVKPLVQQLEFRCMKCGKKIPRMFCDGKFSPPMFCNIQGCKSRSFIPDRSSAQLVDFQKIRIQELASADNHEEGRVPRTVECELTEDLVDCCIPGEIVTVTGIVKVLNNYMDVGGGKSRISNQGLYYLYLEAVSVRKSKSHAVSDKEIQASGICHFQSCTEKDDFAVKYRERYGTDVFRRILQSFCPSIYGHELVKAGITLALFGGVQKNSMDQNKVPVRGDIHVIVVGDPGLGKSQLLQAAAAVSPRGIYVCGNTTTKAGLTVAVVKDSMTNDYAFEAGAMVLADRGICCIDEFDKMFAEHQALLEAMEQQCVSVAKAGLVASLSARTSVLAAANPIGGHYDRAKTVNENLKMSAALLSRFDLVFILLDKPDESLDKRVSDHIIADVVDIMKESLYDKYVDEHGYVDFAWSGGMIQPKEAKRFLNALNKESELQQKDCFSKTELCTLADKISLRVPDFDALVEKINIEGYLIKKGSGMYQLVTASY